MIPSTPVDSGQSESGVAAVKTPLRAPAREGTPANKPRRPKWGAWGGAWCVTAGAIPEAVDVAAVRRAERLTQAAFAKRYGFTLGAVKDWESGRRTPGRATRLLLKLIESEPATVLRHLG